MRPSVPRFVRWAVALSVITALMVTVFQYWGMSRYGLATVKRDTGKAPDRGWAQTQWGPLGTADRDLLVLLWQAGLCGEPSGQQAQQRAGGVQIRTVAKRMWMDYGDLSNQVRSVAEKLSVALPEHPTAQQRSWMKDLSGRSGADFDRVFAQRLRLTDGEALPVITSVRAGTRNELIRSFAAHAAVLVNRHMDSLERTGLVDYSRLPEPLPPAAATLPAAADPPTPGELPDREQHIDHVVNATQATPVPAGLITGNDANAMIAALVSIAGLLIGLSLLGTARRPRRAGATPQHRSVSQRRRHAAQRW